jgi:hypothetical protein
MPRVAHRKQRRAKKETKSLKNNNGAVQSTAIEGAGEPCGTATETGQRLVVLGPS